MDKKIKITLDHAAVADYYELESIFNSGNIKAEIMTQDSDGTEMGFGFRELIVLLPLLTPFVIQFRKILIAYFAYKKPLNKNTSITLECNGRKLEIKEKNGSVPSIEELMIFFDDNGKNRSADATDN